MLSWSSLYGADGSTVDDFAGISIAIGQWHALDAVHVGGQTLNTEQVPEWLRKMSRQLNHPLQGVSHSAADYGSRTQPHGVMIVDEYADAPIIDDQQLCPVKDGLDLLNNITQQTGIAIESERLRAAQQEEAWVNTALLQVAEAVNSLDRSQ